MRGRVTLAVMAAVIAALAGPALGDEAPTFDTGQIPDPVILLPDGPAQGSVMLFSSEDGWTSEDDALAARLQAEGAAVVGIDLPSYLAALDAEGSDCVYLVADYESLGHQLERATGARAFHAPIVAGTGRGGALAINILAQTPFDTLGGAIAGDPSDGVPLDTQFCTKAPRRQGSDGWSYALPAGNQPAPLTVVLSQGATAESAGRVADLSDARVAFQVDAADGSASPTFGDAVAAAVARNAGTSDAPAVVELGTTPTKGVMAIMLSGDGGWRDLDKQIAGILQSKGVPTVGLDTLRWFWSPRTPQETGAELARLIDLYTEKWKVQKVILAGYSFGADVLPASYLALPPEAKAKVAEISLLGLATMGDWQITVSGWLGTASSTAQPTAPALAQLPAALVQCIRGEEEDDSACPSLAGTGAGDRHDQGRAPLRRQLRGAGAEDHRRPRAAPGCRSGAAGGRHALTGGARRRFGRAGRGCAPPGARPRVPAERAGARAMPLNVAVQMDPDRADQHRRQFHLPDHGGGAGARAPAVLLHPRPARPRRGPGDRARLAGRGAAREGQPLHPRARGDGRPRDAGRGLAAAGPAVRHGLYHHDPHPRAAPSRGRWSSTTRSGCATTPRSSSSSAFPS